MHSYCPLNIAALDILFECVQDDTGLVNTAEPCHEAGSVNAPVN